MRNIIITCIVLLIAIAALAAKYFGELASNDNNLGKVLSYVPGDAAFVLNFRNDESFYEIFKDYELFDAIIGEQRASEIDRLKTALLQQNSLSEFVADKDILLSFHPGADSVEFLYGLLIDKSLSSKKLEEALAEIPGTSLKAEGQDIYKVEGPDLQKPFYLFSRGGIVMGSFSNSLLKRCLDRNETHLTREFIAEVNKNNSKNENSPVSLFVNHQAVIPFLQYFLRQPSSNNLSLLKNLSGTSSLSMNFKSDALMFNGISITDTIKPSYLNIFLNQQSAPNQIKKILPENTASFIAFGLSDFNRFNSDLKRYLQKKGDLKKLTEQFNLVQTNTGIDLDRDIKPLFDKEFVLVENSYGEQFAIIKARNGRDLNFKLQLISRPLDEFISQVNHRNIFYFYFGDPMYRFPKPYFAVADNYLIIANTPGIIRNYLSGYQNNRFFANTEKFKQHDQLVANRSNIFYFADNKNSKNLIRTKFKNNISKAFRNEDFGLSEFKGISYQWTADGDHFFTNLYLSYNSSDSLALNP